MFTIKQEARLEERFEYSHEFDLIEDPSCGFSFDCDETGKMDLNPDAQRNYDYAISHPEEYKDRGIVKTRYVDHVPAKGTCICGNEMELSAQYMGACQCGKCGQWYNLFGQALIPPEYWEKDDDYDYDEPW